MHNRLSWIYLHQCAGKIEQGTFDESKEAYITWIRSAEDVLRGMKASVTDHHDRRDTPTTSIQELEDMSARSLDSNGAHSCPIVKSLSNCCRCQASVLYVSVKWCPCVEGAFWEYRVSNCTLELQGIEDCPAQNVWATLAYYIRIGSWQTY